MNTDQGLSRFERRKASTRARIVEAAERLMREHGADDVTIQDITEAADVGHGTFYLHFKNKGEVLRPVIEHLSMEVHDQVDQAAHGAEDPALRLALGLRVLLRAIASDPLWSWYARSGMKFSELVAAMGPVPTNDLNNGLKTGRLKVTDLRATINFIDGAFVGMVGSFDGKNDAGQTADAAAELILRVFGIDPVEASRIVSEPLSLT